LEGIGILIAVDAIPDLFATVTNATGDLAATTLVARFSSSTHTVADPTAIAAARQRSSAFAQLRRDR
jgi:Na+/H+-dicarboxylate symporter